MLSQSLALLKNCPYFSRLWYSYSYSERLVFTIVIIIMIANEKGDVEQQRFENANSIEQGGSFKVAVCPSKSLPAADRGSEPKTYAIMPAVPANKTILSSAMKRRRGVSPVISTTIMIGISVVLGLSLWSFSVSASNGAGAAVTNSTTSYVNYLQDRFTIVHVAYSHDAKNFCADDDTCLTVWIYNNGDLPTKINEVMFGPKVSTMASMPHSPDSLVIQPKTVETITIQYKVNGVNTQFTPDTSYIVKLVTETGAFQQYYEKNVS